MQDLGAAKIYVVTILIPATITKRNYKYCFYDHDSDYDLHFFYGLLLQTVKDLAGSSRRGAQLRSKQSNQQPSKSTRLVEVLVRHPASEEEPPKPE